MEIANIVNLTPHNVNLYVSDDVVVTIPPAPNARPVRVSDAQTLLTGGQWDGPVPIVRCRDLGRGVGRGQRVNLL